MAVASHVPKATNAHDCIRQLDDLVIVDTAEYFAWFRRYPKMKIPSMFFGSSATVASRARKIAKRLLETRDFDSFDPGLFVDTAEQPGILLLRRDRLWPKVEAFHCYALSHQLAELAGHSDLPEVMEAWMLWSFREDWRFLGALGEDTSGVLWRNSALLRPFVDTAVEYWPVLTAEGRRYGPFINEPVHVWTESVNLWYALGNLGIAGGELSAVPPGGPADFLSRIDERKTGDEQKSPGG